MYIFIHYLCINCGENTLKSIYLEKQGGACSEIGYSALRYHVSPSMLQSGRASQFDITFSSPFPWISGLGSQVFAWGQVCGHSLTSPSTLLRIRVSQVRVSGLCLVSCVIHCIYDNMNKTRVQEMKNSSLISYYWETSLLEGTNNTKSQLILLCHHKRLRICINHCESI